MEMESEEIKKHLAFSMTIALIGIAILGHKPLVGAMLTVLGTLNSWILIAKLSRTKPKQKEENEIDNKIPETEKVEKK